MRKSSPRPRTIAIDATLADEPFGPLGSILAAVLGSLSLWALVLSLCFGVARLF